MDIVAKLRDTTGIHEELLYEAADEIGRLREALSFYAKWGVVSPWMDEKIQEDGGAKARLALQQKESE